MSNPKGLITPAQAKELNDAYTERCDLISAEITKRPDNRSSWYSLEDIEAFLSYAKTQAKDLGYEMDGIRIYSGAYPTVDGKAGYTTSFLIPTANGSGEGKDDPVSHDITDADGLNFGQQGHPPNSNYPQ